MPNVDILILRLNSQLELTNLFTPVSLIGEV